MLKFLRDKLISIGRDDEGAAFVITIAVFMFIYLGICGVFAVGKEIKEKIQLQNACDAAAYSAAVVQADTLSRIATLNRAMSWTYSQMTKRQMDYIVLKWLEKTSEKYHQDLRNARLSGTGGAHNHKYWQSNRLLDQGLTLNNHWSKQLFEIDAECSVFKATHISDESFYSDRNNLAKQIQEDSKTIQEISRVITSVDKDGLIDKLPDEITKAVKDVLQANLIVTGDEMIRYSVITDNSFLRKMSSSEEVDFLAFSKSQNEATSWFPLMNSDDGFQHRYVQSEALRSDWNWWYMRWVCTPKGCAPIPSAGNNSVLGSEVIDGYCAVGKTQPHVLAKNYFGRAGTITVGLARYNENPFAKIFAGDPSTVGGRIVSGLFAAFNPFNEWSWAFSSAKAGYLQLGQEFDDNGAPSRKYKIDWNGDQTWNLCQSEWDAVFVPVRRAKSLASDGAWQDSDYNILEDMVYSGGWQWLGEATSYQKWADVPAGGTTVAGDGSHYVQWNVQNPGKNLDWDRLSDRMFH